MPSASRYVSRSRWAPRAGNYNSVHLRPYWRRTGDRLSNYESLLQCLGTLRVMSVHDVHSVSNRRNQLQMWHHCVANGAACYPAAPKARMHDGYLAFTWDDKRKSATNAEHHSAPLTRLIYARIPAPLGCLRHTLRSGARMGRRSISLPHPNSHNRHIESTATHDWWTIRHQPRGATIALTTPHTATPPHHRPPRPQPPLTVPAPAASRSPAR